MGHIKELQRAFELTIEEYGRRVKCGPAPYHAINTQYHEQKHTLTLRIELPRSESSCTISDIKTVEDGFSKEEASSLKDILGESPYYASLIEATAEATQILPSLVEEDFEDSYCFKVTDSYIFIVITVKLT